jgi:aspartyl-tRNA(Asn)/glutamyl-tRNA(Gln) amidotransferase subunit A
LLLPTEAPIAFKDRATDRDATVVRKLLDAGVVVLGKTNMNEFAAGVSGTNATFGDTHNPWNLERSPGGSSSGTGAAITAGLCLGGPGTDTGGSIRVPASWLGITGMRPTFGLVSLDGVYPRSRSLDCVGPLARNVHDLALLLDVMAGFDPKDPNSSWAQPRYVRCWHFPEEPISFSKVCWLGRGRRTSRALEPTRLDGKGQHDSR